MGTDSENSRIKKIVFYDFDGTLFRSPETPGWWHKEKWYDDIRSLDSTTVTMMPPDMTWVEPVVEKAFYDCLSPRLYTVLATGRKEKVFRDRIEEMIAEKGLVFNEVHLNPGMSTGQYKATEFFKIYHRFPEIEVVEFWDDNEVLLKAYLDIFQGFGVQVFGHLIKTRPVHLDVDQEEFFAPRLANTYLESKKFL